MDRFSAIEKTTVDFPVKIWVYQTSLDMQPAIASRRGQGSDQSIRTLGEVAASDTALVSRDTDFLDIVRHELTHVVTGAATRGFLLPIPIWINEGISTYAQNNLLPSESQAFANAVQRNQVLPITSLAASNRDTGNSVSLFYSESGSIIAFMIEKLGQDKFGDFIAAMKNDTTEGALQTVYGFDYLGLENAWRQAVGLPQVDPNAPTPTQAPKATATPRASSSNAQPANTPRASSPSSSTANDSGGGVSVIVIVLAVLAGVLVLLLGTAGFLVMKGRRSSG